MEHGSLKTMVATILRLPDGFALAASVVLAAGLLLAPDRARAFDECGALNAGNSYTETCTDTAYASGIAYRNIVANAMLTVGGGMATTITSLTTGASYNNAIGIANTAAAARRDISLTVGSAGAVVILQGSSPQANAFYRNQGIFVSQTGGGGSTTTVDVRSGVTIGTSATRMANRGIHLQTSGSHAPTGAGAMSLTSGATIYAATHGIGLTNGGPGTSTVANTGAIDASNQGIHVVDSGSAGAVTVTNSGAITAAWQGIFAQTTGKDAAGTNAGISVTHSAGAITSSNNRGIHVLVGASRQESNTGHASYVAPINTGTAKIAVTGGSISASQIAIEAINYEAGGIDIDVSPGVTLTSSTGSGIYAGLQDVGNEAGGIDVDNAGEITAAVTGIWVRRTAPMGAGAIRVDNDGDIRKTGAGAGYGIRVDESGIGGVTVDNSGAIGDATTQHQYGIFVSHGSAGAGDVSITNSGAIHASLSGIHLDNLGTGDSAVTNSGAITASQRGIYVRERGSAGAVTVVNSGAITATWTGILAQTTGKDAMGDDHGVSVTHSGGAIASADNQGIQALVGVGRAEIDPADGAYVAPENTGTAKVAVTGGSISARLTAIEAINLEAGGVDVDVSSGVTLTSSTASGIFAGLIDVGNTAGAIDVDNAGDITAATTGIWVRQNGAMNTGAITIDNEGAIKKTGADEGYGIRVDQSGNGDVTVVNSGAIGEAAATQQHRHGIWLPNPGSGDSSVTNSGAIRAERNGILVDDTGSDGAVTVANSGAITAAWQGIRATSTGKDAANTDAGVSVTHSGGAITSSDNIGIQAHVGTSRQEGNTGHADYVRPMNEGLVKVEVTGGSIRSKRRTIEAINFEAGSVEVRVSSGVALTVTGEDHGIFAQVADVGNTDGTVTVVNAGTIGAPAEGKRGIFAVNEAGGAVSVTSSGAITAGGIGIYADLGVVTVANGADITSDLSGIFARTPGRDEAGTNLGVTVIHSGGAIASENGRGVRAHVGWIRAEIDPDHADYVRPMNEGLVKVAVAGGSIESKWQAVDAVNFEAGGIDIDIAAGATLTSTANNAINAQLTDVGNTEGMIDIDNAGTLKAAVHGVFSRIVAGAGDMTVTNSGAIEAPGSAIFALGARSHTGAITVTNSGALGTADAKVFRGIFVAHEGPSGTVTVANSGDVTATDYGILANKANGRGGTTVTHSGGAIDVKSPTGAPVLDSQKHGIVARVGGWNQETDPDHADYVAPRGTGAVKVSVTGGSIDSTGTAVEGANYEGGGVEIAIASGVTLSSQREHGIEADLRDVGNAGGTIKIAQGGAIRAGGDGVNAKVARWHADPGTLTEPVIDVTWTGTYVGLEQPADAESILFVALAPRVVQAAQAVAALETLRAESAGIDAGVIEWAAFMGLVAAGDDPGAFADAAAQASLFDDSADDATKARAAAILAQFRSVLTVGAAGPIRDAGDVDADGDDEYSDEEITAYLSVDSDARRTLLRNVLADTLTAQEMAVFRAVMEGEDVDAALDAVTGATDAWKARVRALSESRNDGDIRIRMNGGSIVSPGDGIRAFYGAHREGNGRIEVTVAEGATVTGKMAGIYVANAGDGLEIEKRYAPEAVRAANPNLGEDDMVTVEGHHNQVVRVDGVVTGGADAAVHLGGGGALIVGPTGKLIGGTFGRAILVNHPQPAAVFIGGEATGGAGPEDDPAPAAVHLTGGGVVTIGPAGQVDANGAALAIRVDDANRAAGAAPTGSVRVQVEDGVFQETGDEVAQRVQGNIGGDALPDNADGGKTVVFVPVDDQGNDSGMGIPVSYRDGKGDTSDREPRRILAFCERADDRRCHLYEALPSVLLAMNGLPGYDERMSAARSANGGWARVEALRGKWKADSSTQAGLAYDHSRTGLRAGLDLAVSENARVGVAAHGLDGSAKMTQGKIELRGMGLGLGATVTSGGFYFDAQAAATWYDVDVTSMLGRKLKDGAKGTGHAVALEAGRSMTFASGLSLTPHAGVVWSRASLKDFRDSWSIDNGEGTPVSVKKARSLEGRAGLRVEGGGADGAGLRMFGSVDVTREFSKETQAQIADTALRADAAANGIRIGLGGVYGWGNGRYAIRGMARYTAASGGNNAFGGSLNLAVRF